MSETVDYKKDFLLSEFWELAYRAHSGTSFSPERRANDYIKSYSKELENDLKELGEKCGNYQEKYKAMFSAWMSSKSNCISSMITGGSNFPVRRAEKANNAERRKQEDFFLWREKYFKAVNRQPVLSPEEDLDSMVRKMDATIVLNENIKVWNKAIRKFKKGGVSDDELVKELSEHQMPDQYLRMLQMSLDYSYWKGFGTLGATIKKQRERCQELKERIEAKSTWEDIEFDGGSITVDDDRVKIFHNEKPSQDIINALRGCGFKWSRNWGCWCRKHTKEAIRVAKSIVLN